MTEAADACSRRRALTDMDATLLVEAAAGTGKTSLIAGRMTMLLATGYEPRHLAAITFMEAAAAELSARVHQYVHELLSGKVPRALKSVLPDGLSDQQRSFLVSARDRLDELTTCTIHGFCQTIICRYAAEASVDPGARVIDAGEAEVLFDGVFDRWLRARLSTDLSSTDPIAVLSREAPKNVVSTVRELAHFRLAHRTARAVTEDLTGRPDRVFAEAVDEFRRWAGNTPPERDTLVALADLEALAAYYADSFASPLDFPALWRLAHPTRVGSMQKDSFQLKPLRCKSAWIRLAGASDGSRLHDEAMSLYLRAEAAFREIHGKVATSLVARLSNELDEVLGLYGQFKRSAALLDFDDLLYSARELIVNHEDVRVALGQRYSQLLVDEFQDTDPIQAEILFRIAAASSPTRWDEAQLRDGVLFMVGDPKQAIFRFRGADIETYSRAKRAIERIAPQNVLHVNASFRSQSDILEHVNACFDVPLSRDGQHGYVPLIPTRERSTEGLQAVATWNVRLPEELQGAEPRADDVRDAEAADVAHVCRMLIGNMDVRCEDGSTRKLTAADIALLTPQTTGLFRYEQALERRGLPFASQAGRNLYGRQEVQDLLSLTRVLADPLDTLAFGALMRGPLVGLTEQELLDITAELAPDEPAATSEQTASRFTVLSDPAAVMHPVARETLNILQELRRRSSSTTPALLLSEAIESLQVRSILVLREGDRANQALANVDAFLEFAGGYRVRGLRQFAIDIAREWRGKVPRYEGRVDAAGEAIEIVTIHRSKGLEWPVVILINTFTRFRPRDQFVHRRLDDTLHWVIKDVVPPELERALDADAQSLALERERLLYVAFTRARDLLVLPKVPDAGDRSWTAIIPDQHRHLHELKLSGFEEQPAVVRREESNKQTAEVFATQQAAILTSLRDIKWVRPSQDDLDRVQVIDEFAGAAEDLSDDDSRIVGAGQVRGLILHKLMEEVLNAETSDVLDDLVKRAEALLVEITSSATSIAAKPLAQEMASTVLKTLALSDIAILRSGLVPELSVFGHLSDATSLIAGRADAVSVQDGQAQIVIDWKSDVAPSHRDVEGHAAQLQAYMRATRVMRGALVYMSIPRVHWIELEGL